MPFPRTVVGAVALALAAALACSSDPERPQPPPTATPLVRTGPDTVPLSPGAAAQGCVELPLPAPYNAGHVPAWNPGGQYADLVAQAVELYRSQEIDYTYGIRKYRARWSYLRYGRENQYELDPTLQFDDRGIPLVEYDGQYQYNPSTVAQFALTMHGRTLRGAATEAEFLAAADALIALQDERGALPNQFAFTYYRTGEVLAPGWVSALAQGQALSVFRRAFDVSGDARYIEAGNAALAFLLTSAADGGPRDTLARLDPSLDRFVFFREYPTRESQYTLNGFLFVLLGLYDWSDVAPGLNDDMAARADDFLRCGLATAAYILPYYDVGGFSAYDLGHAVEGGAPNLQAERHAIHIQLLHALSTISPEPAFTYWRDAWIADVP